MGLLKAKRRLAGLGGRELEGSTRSVRDPQRPLELEAGQPFQVLGVPFPQLRVVGVLTRDGILHHGVAEVIHHGRDGEDATQPLVQTFVTSLSLFWGVVFLACAYALSSPANTAPEAAATTSPAATFRLVIEVEPACAMVTSLRIVHLEQHPSDPCCC